MRTTLLMLSALIVVMIFCLFNIDFVSSVIPGWNTTIPNFSPVYALVLIFNVVLPIYLGFSFRREIKRYVFFAYFGLVNAIFLYAKMSSYFLFCGGSVSIDRMQKEMVIQMILVMVTLVIHLVCYLILFFKRGGSVG